MKRPAILLYGASEADADVYYATGMFVPDPFLYLDTGARSLVVMSDLEIGRAREEADVDEVVSLSELNRELKNRGISAPGAADHAAFLLRRHRVRRVEVPDTFPFGLAERLRKRGIRVEARPAPFFRKRVVKRPDEIRAMERCQRANEEALAEAVRVLRKSRPNGKYLRHRGEVLTAEALRRVIHRTLLEFNCQGKSTIVSSGDQGCDPHNRGSGPLLAHASIILDIFPRSLETNYCSDMTRTVCRGRPSRELERLYDTVREGQELGCRRIRAGARGVDVHRPICALFEERGYKTEPRKGKMVGFFHGTGHGIGLDVHEPPRVGWNEDRLPAGAVVTCEPGLYYFGVGGVRIEDMLLVGRRRSRNLTRASKEFVI